MLEYAGATNNFSTYFRPIISCPGIIPMILTLFWSGAINITTLQDQVPGLYGSVVSFFSPLIFSVVISLLYPSRFDWREFLRIELIEDPNSALPSKTPSSIEINEVKAHQYDDVQGKERKDLEVHHATANPSASVSSAPVYASPIADPKIKTLDDVVHPFGEETIRHIKHWLKIASAYFVINVLVTIVLWPLPLYRDWIFTKSFWDGWIGM